MTADALPSPGRPDAQAMAQRMAAAALALTGIGLVFVYSASSIWASRRGWEMSFLASQLAWLGLGLGGLAVAARIDYRRLRALWIPAGLVMAALLVAVRVPGIGTPVRGAYRWLRFGGLNMQPSELAKIGLVLVVSALLARHAGRLSFRRLCPIAGVVGLVTGLIAIEPDFGTAALVGAVATALLLVGGARIWHLSLFAAASVPPLVFYGLTRFDHIRNRVADWFAGSAEGTGYQTFMSKVALGSGGPWGVGLGEGQAKLFYLPDAHTDFILAIVGQETGLAGTLLVTALFAAFVFEGLRLVRATHDRFGQLLAFGIVATIGLQAAFNIAVVTASIPPKGISLPFVSFGGSGLCIALAEVGLLLSIARHGAEAQAADRETDETGGDAPSRASSALAEAA